MELFVEVQVNSLVADVLCLTSCSLFLIPNIVGNGTSCDQIERDTQTPEIFDQTKRLTNLSLFLWLVAWHRFSHKGPHGSSTRQNIAKDRRSNQAHELTVPKQGLHTNVSFSET
eukprot:5141141-Amphidinium_carterae.2